MIWAENDENRLYRHSGRMTDPQKSMLRDLLNGGSGEFHHGDCIGADSEAHDVAILCGYTVVLHPPTNTAKRAWRDVPQHLMRAQKPYLVRNKDIVTETASLIAAPADPVQQHRSGTWSTVRFARQRGKPVLLILSYGTVKR